MDDFGLLSVWHRPKENNHSVLARVWIVHPKFVPKILVVTQLGGAGHTWTVPLYMLRSADWNAQLPHIPLPPADPETENGVAHPLYGPKLSADQIYQHQLGIWMQQNQQHGQNYNQQQGQHHQQHQVQHLQHGQ